MALRLKADFATWLHTLRARQISTLFAACPPGAFPRALELGAGDGYVSTLLTPYCSELVSTDYFPEILRCPPHPGVTYRVVDAEQLTAAFPQARFDLVFSSNLLEHLPDAQRVLHDAATLLTDGGVMVHLVPNRTWLVLHTLLHLPNKLANVIEAATGPGGVAALHGKLRGETGPGPVNNPKTARAQRGLCTRLLLPEPHGVSPTLRAEWTAFAAARWRRDFAAAGLDLVAVRSSICSSGYGFGWERLRRFAEACGLATETAYIAVRHGERPRDSCPGLPGTGISC